MFRFLLTRRWLSLLLAVVVVAVACVELGLWQFRRYDERQTSNQQIRGHLAADPIRFDQVFSTDHAPDEAAEWTDVTATGTYDADHQLLVIYRNRDGSPGVDVVVPLITSSGAALLVDRGWVATTAGIDNPADVPAPPTGTVTVTGWVRRNAEGGSSQVIPSQGSVRAISSNAIKPLLPYGVYDGFLDLTKEDPAPAVAPAPAVQPDLGSGPSFFYGLQWFFFALLALAFWCYFAWSEYRDQSGRSAQPRLDTIDPVRVRARE